MVGRESCDYQIDKLQLTVLKECGVETSYSQHLGVVSVAEPDFDVGQVPPVCPGQSRDVPHASLHQGAHVFADMVTEQGLEQDATNLRRKTTDATNY